MNWNYPASGVAANEMAQPLQRAEQKGVCRGNRTYSKAVEFKWPGMDTFDPDESTESEEFLCEGGMNG